MVFLSVFFNRGGGGFVIATVGSFWRILACDWYFIYLTCFPLSKIREVPLYRALTYVVQTNISYAARKRGNIKGSHSKKFHEFSQGSIVHGVIKNG